MILVTGGSGLVGKHLKEVLPDAVYISSRDFDLMDINRVDDMMDFFKPKVVVHLAARVGNLIDKILTDIIAINLHNHIADTRKNGKL